MKTSLLSFTVGWLALGAFGSGCAPDPELSVELMTDLASGTDFDGIYVERAKDALSRAPRCGEGSNMFERSANYRLGAAIGEPEKVRSGETWVVRVALCKGDDLIIERSVKSEIQHDTQLRIVMAVDCFEKQCQGAAPCDYKSCEPNIKCHWGDPAACEDPACGGPASARCAPDFECVAGDCLHVIPVDAFTDAGPELDGQISMSSEAGRPDGMLSSASEAGFDAGDSRTFVSDGQVETDAADSGPNGQARVLYVGDALAAESEGRLRWWLGLGMNTEVHAAVGGRLAICDFLDGKSGGVPVASKLAAQVKAHAPHLIVMQFWGDALTPCMADVPVGSQAYFDRYKADAEEAVRQIEQAALDARMGRPKILWVLQGPEPVATLRDRPRALNQIYQELALRAGDRTSDAGKWVSMEAYPYEDGTVKDRYQWSQFLPCLDYEMGSPDCFVGFGPLVQLHRGGPDDAGDPYLQKTLFCLANTDANFACDGPSPGANRYALQIAGDINAWLGL